MAAVLERTCWREIQVDHPPQWELAVASGAQEPGRLTFSDRRYHRLDIRWRPLKYVPNLDLVLSGYKRKQKGDKTKYSHLTSAPSPWKGLVRKTTGTTVVHAVRFYRDVRLLTDVAIVWPGARRDISLENALLESLQARQADGQPALWQAMGLSVQCPAGYDLRQSSRQVGRIQWDFFKMAGQDKIDKRAGVLRVERIAMPDHLLNGRAIRDWLVDELPAGFHTLRQRTVPQGRHSADELISAAKTGLFARIAGSQQMRLDLAWLCPIEGRIYHVQFSEKRQDEDIALPASWQVNCCKAAPPVRASRHAG